MLKDHFQKSTSTLNLLRSQHFKVSEYLNKGKYRLKKKLFSTAGKAKYHYDFDLNTQQFIHEQIDDIIFSQTQIQQIFYNEIYKSLENSINFNNKTKVKDFGIGIRKNPSEVRVLLARHFQNRAVDLSYKKYQTLLRIHNLGQQQHLTAIKSRTHLIQKQIQLCMSRQTRLEVQDYFEQSYTQGGKPKAGNENGKPIYKELDQQQCWFSNITRADIQAYIRNTQFREDILNNAYWPYWYRCEYIVFTHGLQLCKKVQAQFLQSKNKDKENVLAQAKFMIKKLDKGLQDMSQSGNLVQKQNLSNFVFNITGINNQQPICIPMYPATYYQLIDHYKKSTDTFFGRLPVSSHKQIIDLIPKLNSFCLIAFKYQNKQILEGKKEIRLGLEDQVDIRKQLVTMLQQQWVNKYITKLDFERFQYKLELKKVDWQIDEYSLRMEQQNRLVNGNGYAPDSSLDQLIRAIRMTQYLQFRRIMKKRSQKVQNRVKTKYEDMFLVQKYFRKSQQQINMQKLSQIYNIKQIDEKQLKKGQISEITKSLFDRITSVLLIKNPVEIQITETLTCIKVRQIRTRILNICNGFRCYQRNINMDLRVIDGCQFTYQLDDDYLINTNKQVLERFEKQIKQNQTGISKAKSQSIPPTKQQQDFLIHKKLQKSMFYLKDKIKRQYFGKDPNSKNTTPHILVIDGRRRRKILYNKSLQDLKFIQARILQLGTHFINKYETIIKMKSLPQIIDRVNVMCQLFQLEEKYLYEKFNLVQAYYYLYENTVEPLNAHKIGKIILQLMYQIPKIDINSGYYKFSYQTLIETLQMQTKIVKVYTKLLQDEQKQKNKIFHKKFAKMCEIPLTLWAYAYKDMQVKTGKNYTKIQRMSSVSSKLSKASKQSKQKQAIAQIKDKINQEFGEDSENQPEEFDIERYDQYALRSMDQLFKDIVGGNEQNNKDKDGTLGTSSLGLENITINPKFQGGPHALHNYLPNIMVTSQQQQKLLNFSQNICMVANIHQLIKKLSNQAKQRYGYCSLQYQLCVKKHICIIINKILHEQPIKYPQFHQFQTDDIYLQTVTKDINTFETVMNPILFLPSKTQLSLQATHQIHQRNYLSQLSQSKALEKFDAHIIGSLIKLEKPLNTAVYRQLNLSINFMELLRLRRKIRQIQYRRQQIFNAYKVLGQYGNYKIQKYEHCYTRSGQSNTIFDALSEIKLYNDSIKKHPTLNQSVQQLRTVCQLEQTQLKLFHSHVEMSKQQLEGYIRFLWDVERDNQNKIINRNALLISLTKSNVEMMAKKIKNFIKIIGEDVFQARSYAKTKLGIKAILQEKLRLAHQTQLNDLILKHYLDNETKKYNNTCFTILAQKLKKNIIQQYIKSYTGDLKHQLMNNQTFVQLTKSIKTLKNYIDSLPYLSKLFTIPTQFQKLLKQKFDDQKKLSIVEQKNQGIDDNLYYIYSKEQLIDNWFESMHNIAPIKLNQTINYQEFVKSTLPPGNKQLTFKWMYKIPTNNISQPQKQSLRHLLKVYEPFTGKISASEYRYSRPETGSRNKFSQLAQKYSILLQYIQSNLMVICLQVDDDILDSIVSIIDHGYKFQERYPLRDQISIYETYSKQGEKQAQYMKDSVLAPCFLYENKKDQLEKKLKIKLSSRGYTNDKNGVRYSIIDQITDFIVSKVQGYGVFRHSMLEMKDQIEIFKKTKPEIAINYMKNKTKNIYSLMWLALWENYNSKNDVKTNTYTPIFLDQILSIPKQQTFKTSLCNNARRGISKQIQSDLELQQQQKLKFNKGIYDLTNDLLTTKLKVIYNFIPLDLNDLCERYIYRSENQTNQIETKESIFIARHNWQNFSSFKQMVKKPGEKFRFELFGRLRDQFQKTRNFIKTKTDSSNLLQLIQFQQKKYTFLEYIIHTKINMIALTAFRLAKPQSFPDNPYKFCQQFNRILKNNKQKIQYSTFNIYDQLEAYQSNGKIVFSKTENSLMVKGPLNSQSIQHCNKLVRTIIFSKLTVQQFRNQILQVAIKLLRNENLRKNDKKSQVKSDNKMQSKKVQNQSYLPRVHLISSFSSPLIIQRKTYISQQHKLAFVQAFINRFRNKVSRVDLLSSGFGFVITVPDLQDCLNYMNKLLFTFTEKEFKSRLDTFSQYFQILKEGIKQRDQKLAEQNQIIKYLQDKLKNTIQADYLSKVSKLLQEKYLIQQKLALSQQAANGLQHRIRKAVQYQYDTKITSLEKQNQYLRSQFMKFKDLFIKLAKDQTKNNFLSLVNILKEKVSKTLDKKIDLSQSFTQITQLNKQSPQKGVKVRQNQSKQSKNSQINRQYGQEDIQRCKIGQDIIHDPYYVTKLINKMRLFNIFKLGSKRIKFQNVEQKRVKQLTSLHKIQDKVVVQSQKQYQVQKQFILKNQENSIKQKQLQITKQALSNLQNEKQKLKQQLIVKEKKFQQKQRQIQQYKKYKIQLQKIQKQQGKKKHKNQSRQSRKAQNLSQQIKIDNKEKGQQPITKLSNVRHHKKSIKLVDQDNKSFLTSIQDRTAPRSLYENFQLSNKDSTWREKCQQLYIENRKLQSQIQQLKRKNKDNSEKPTGVTTPIRKQGYSLNVRNKKPETIQKEPSTQYRLKFPNPSYKYSIMKE